ncbi:hypothetical protein AK812_SmicGene47282, partial [Symbiodinium microadriaticum]
MRARSQRQYQIKTASEDVDELSARISKGKAEDARMTKFGNNCELRTAEL